MPRQEVLAGVLPPLTEEQDAALLYADALYEVEVKKEQADKRKDEMIAALAAKRKTRVEVVDPKTNYRHIFEIEDGPTKVRHRAKLEQTMVKGDDDLKG